MVDDVGLRLSLVIRIAAFLMFALHARMVYGHYLAGGDTRSLRELVLTISVVMGTFAIAVGGAARLWPWLTDTARVVGVIAGGGLLVCAVFITATYARHWLDRGRVKELDG